MVPVDGSLCVFGGRPLFLAGGLTSSTGGMIAADDAVPICDEDMILVSNEGKIGVDGSLGVVGGRPLFLAGRLAASVEGIGAVEDMFLVSE